MIDKGKYASHGAYIKKINQSFLVNWSKPKMALIQPEPSTKPRPKPLNHHSSIKLNSQTFHAKFKFQQDVSIKPLTNDLVQPFLYIEKVLNKNKKKEKKVKLQPFITSKIVNKNRPQSSKQASSKAPAGYSNLFEFETDKKNTANQIFRKMLESDIDNVKDLFHMWNKDTHRKLSADINIEEEQFIDFVRELIPNKVSNKHIKHFFEIYCSQTGNPKPKEEEDTGRIKKSREISIRAFAFNYAKYKKSETQIINIMSEKAMKDRYTDLKKYVADYLAHYRDLKQAMQGIKEYEETLRSHFHRTYDAYTNPFAQEISHLTAELQKPIVKYDKEKKEMLEKKVEELEEENHSIHSKLTEDYNNFMESYESAIVKNHDLFFTKRTVAYLLWPIIQSHPYLTRDLIEEQVEIRQAEKQRYLECLSEIVVEMDTDKKHLDEDCFTLEEIVSIVTMKFRRNPDPEEEKFTIESLKKLIKEVKRQFLKKHNLLVENFDAFPADQEISMQILHTCFEMECTKVLFKNQIWSELLLMIPTRSVLSRLHQLKIDANTCMEYLNKYFKKLDERSTLELNKSKEISLLVENAHNQNFGKYADVVNRIMMNVDHYVEDEEEEKERQKDEKGKEKKKVGFADIVDAQLAVERGQKIPHDMFADEADSIAKNVIKMIHTGGIAESIMNMGTSQVRNSKAENASLFQSLIRPEGGEQFATRNNEPIPENLTMLKTLARSYFEPEAMNTNAFDIRFYEKIAEEEKRNSEHLNEQVVNLGTSMLLMNAPRPEEIIGKQQDPLRISRFLLKTIDEDVKQQQKEVKHKQYESGIREGIDHNYYREKIKLQNKPTKFDSQGKSKYSVLMPVGYYESYIVGENVPDSEKWYLRPHHVETLTENPLSKKDNVIHTEYQSKLEKLGLKKRPDEFVIEENMKRKEDLINNLEDRIQALKGEVVKARRSGDISGCKVAVTTVNDYYEKITEGKDDKQLELAAYEGMLFDLRRAEREMLNDMRGKESKLRGEPNEKWWERKDKDFNQELRKDREIVADSQGKHREYINKLKNNEIY